MADNAGRNVAILGSGDGDRLSPDAGLSESPLAGRWAAPAR